MCDSTQLTLQKRGFSLTYSLIGFLLMSALLTFIWVQIFNSQAYENKTNYDLAIRFHLNYTAVDYVHNVAFWIATAFLLAASFLTGLIGARKNRTVCLNCGNVKKLSHKTAFKAATAIVFMLISLTAFSQQHHRRYNFSSSHKGEHHYKNQGGYHAERYKYRKHRN